MKPKKRLTGFETAIHERIDSLLKDRLMDYVLLSSAIMEELQVRLDDHVLVRLDFLEQPNLNTLLELEKCCAWWA